MNIVKRNMAVMNPSWILHSEDAKDILAASEGLVSKVEQPMQTWMEFTSKLDTSTRSGIMAWWNKYSKVIRNINNG